jgi:hypothetical protein
MEMSFQIHAPVALTPGKKPGTYWLGGCVGLTVGVNDEVKRKKYLLLPGVEPRVVHPVTHRCTE